MNLIPPFKILIKIGEWKEIDFADELEVACNLASMYVESYGENAVQMKNKNDEILA